MAANRNSALLAVQDLRMYYRLVSGATLKAVDGVTFSIKKGDKLGLIGESGCGKTSLAMTLMGLLPENACIPGGSILYEGEDLLSFSPKQWREFRWEKMSMVFQSAMNALDPVYRVGNQLSDVYRLHRKCSKEDAIKHIEDLFKLTGLPLSRIRSYPHQLSGGMKQRVIIAMSLLCNPSLIIADEPTTGLDVIIQDQIMREIASLIDQLGLSMVLVSHDVSVVTETCNKILVMYGGKVGEYGDITDVFAKPSHPYTIGLLKAFPNIRGPIKGLAALPGTPPNLSEDLAGCRFAPRCPRKEALCENEDPPEVQLAGNHVSCCHFAEDPELKNVDYSGLNE
jgi:oligopeptide/dipeptide ABC transporter ATP-binding protein